MPGKSDAVWRQQQLEIDATGQGSDLPEDAWCSRPREAAAAWLSNRSDKTYQAHSLEQYVAMLGAATDWWQQEERDMTLLTASADDVLAFLATRGRVAKNSACPDRIASPTTKRRYLGLLDAVFSHLQTQGLRHDNPAAELLQNPELNAPARSAPTFLCSEAETRYVEWVRHAPVDTWRERRDRALRLIFLASGITLEEARRLRVADINFDQDDSTLEIGRHHRANARSAPLARWAVDDLQQWMDVRPRAVKELGVVDSGAVFLSSIIGPAAQGGVQLSTALSDTEIYEIIRPAMEVAVGENALRLGPQTLRNTFAVRQLRHGASDASIMRWLGLHTSFTLSALRTQIGLAAGEKVA